VFDSTGVSKREPQKAQSRTLKAQILFEFESFIPTRFAPFVFRFALFVERYRVPHE
jgi:hypothetical protein